MYPCLGSVVGETSEDGSNLTLFGAGGSSLSWILLYLLRLSTVGFRGESTEATEFSGLDVD